MHGVYSCMAPKNVMPSWLEPHWYGRWKSKLSEKNDSQWDMWFPLQKIYDEKTYDTFISGVKGILSKNLRK